VSSHLIRFAPLLRATTRFRRLTSSAVRHPPACRPVAFYCSNALASWSTSTWHLAAGVPDTTLMAVIASDAA